MWVDLKTEENQKNRNSAVEYLKIKRVHARAGSSPAFGTSKFSGLSKDRPLFCISENAATIAAQ